MAKKEVLRNEDGHKLTKNGSVDQRSVKALENLKKSSVYQNIMKAKEGVAEAKKQDTQTYEEESEEESDEEPEFEIHQKTHPIKEEVKEEVKEEEVKETAKMKFVEEKNDIEERTKKWLEEHREASRKEKEEVKRQADEEIRKLKEENKKLKGLGAYNDHLSRISHLARNVSIKF
jgi:hypothetical protein